MRSPEPPPDGDEKLPMVGVMCPDSAIDASYFAAALARRMADLVDGHVALVDGQGVLGGIDVLADLEHAAGPRWPALRHVTGEVDGAGLVSALPTRDRVAVLSAARHPEPLPDASAVIATVAALREATDACVISLGHNPELAAACDHVLMLVRGTVGALAAADQALKFLSKDQVLGVALEMSAANRAIVGESFGIPLVASAPTRWRIGPVCASSVLVGAWPADGDRTMRRLVNETASAVASRGRSLAWA